MHAAPLNIEIRHALARNPVNVRESQLDCQWHREDWEELILRKKPRRCNLELHEHVGSLPRNNLAVLCRIAGVCLACDLIVVVPQVLVHPRHVGDTRGVRVVQRGFVAVVVVTLSRGRVLCRIICGGRVGNRRKLGSVDFLPGLVFHTAEPLLFSLALSLASQGHVLYEVLDILGIPYTFDSSPVTRYYYFLEKHTGIFFGVPAIECDLGAEIYGAGV